MSCSCIYAAHCDDRAGCALSAGGTVNDYGGVCRRSSGSAGSRPAPGACDAPTRGDVPQGPVGGEPLTTRESDDRVGVGPTYDAIRAAARDLAPLFGQPPGVPAAPYWGAGLVLVEPAGDGRHDVAIVHPVCSSFVQRRNSLVATIDLVELRSMAITLLAYCETHDPVDG